MGDRLVSIIIPIYNVSAYLDGCVRSACDQTYKDLEIILVDDGSQDDCPRKCDAWAEKDPRIKVIHKPNGGLSDARNAGLDAATGKYIYFLDGDDTIEPNLVDTVVPYMESGVDMVTFHFYKLLNNGIKRPVMYHELGEYVLTDPSEKKSFIVEKLLSGRIGWEAWSRMYSRTVIEKYGFRFADNRVIFAEDLYFCLCYCAHAKKVLSIDDCLYNYRIRNDSIMGTDGAKLNIGRMNELAKSVLVHLQKYEDCQGLVACFPAIHYLILDNVLTRALHATKLSSRDFRKVVLEDMGDLDFFRAQMKRLPKYYDLLCLCFSGSQAAERISYMRYLLNGNYNALRIRNRMIYKFANILDRNTAPAKAIGSQYRALQKQKKRVFLLGTEEYGNIGDHQINESVLTFLQAALPDYTIHEVTAREWPAHKVFLKKYIRKNDLIVFSGGGNFGDAYPSAQKFRGEVIRLWPQNPKIVFPQTIDFSDTDEGKEMLTEACLQYTQENRIALFTREQQSFAFAQAHFSCDSYLAPDIVLSSVLPQGTSREPRILLCFRRDIEKSMSEETVAAVEYVCKDSGLSVEQTDLQLDYYVNRSGRQAIIREKFDLWRRAKVVITDRLHGMIFAAITGTPCIVFSNYNHKVRGTYEWIKYLPYIRYAESVTDVEEYLPELLEMRSCAYDNAPLKPYFDQLAKVVKEYAHN